MRLLPRAMASRFNVREAELYAAGKCGYLTEYGTGRGFVYCEEPVKDPSDIPNVTAERTYCAEHCDHLVANGYSFP